MTVATHTAGPWVTGNTNDGSRKTAVWSANGDYMIAVCASASLSLEGNRANARLIAAAPEVLGALKDLLSVETDPGMTPEIAQDDDLCSAFVIALNGRINAAVAKAKAAIAKATGGPQ